MTKLYKIKDLNPFVQAVAGSELKPQYWSFPQVLSVGRSQRESNTIRHRFPIEAFGNDASWSDKMQQSVLKENQAVLMQRFRLF